MTDAWMSSIESLIERWRSESEPIDLPEVEIPSPAPAAQVGAAAAPDLRPALTQVSREHRQGLTELAEAVRGSMAALAQSLKDWSDRTPDRPAAETDAGLATNVGERIDSFRDEMKGALASFAETVASSGSAGAAAGEGASGQAAAAVLESIKSALESAAERMAEATREDIAKLGEMIRSSLSDFSEEDMVGRAGLAKSLKIGMADLAEKNRRTMEELRAALAAGASGAKGGSGDLVSFHPEPIPDPSFESSGKVGAFPRDFEEDEGRRISVPDCYAAVVNDDSMAPLACEGHTLLVSRAVSPRNGDLVLAQSEEGRWVFRRYVKREDQHQLQSLNPQLGLPAVVLEDAPQRMHVVVGVLFGSPVVRAELEAEAAAAAGAGAGSD
jgi:hypothetical protein